MRTGWLGLLALVVAAGCSEDPPPERILYLNRHGGTYLPGDNDSVTDHQGISTGVVDVPSYPFDETSWLATRDCVAALFSRYRIAVVDQAPGQVDHLEVVVTTLPSVFSLPDTASTVIPIDRACGVRERGLAMVFAGKFAPADTQVVCELVARSAGAMIGLDLSTHCPDVMSVTGGCGPKTFVDVEAPCAHADGCRCGEPTQSSERVLADHLGLR